MAPRRRVLLGLATAGLLALAGWAIAALWGRAGLPFPPFQPGLTGHPPDPRAWPRLLAIAVPALFGAASLLHGWLDPGPGWSRARRLDAWSYLGLPAFLLLEVAAGQTGAGPAWLGGAYLVLVALKVGLLVGAASALATPDADPRPDPARGSPGPDVRLVRLSRAVLGISALAYVASSAFVITRVSTTGDEPYYLLVAHSLARDGDLDLANQFERQDYRPFYWGSLYSGQNTVRSEAGGLYSVTYSGLLAFLLAPGYRLAGRLGAALTISLLAAWLVQQLFLLAWETTGHRRVALLTWTLLAFTAPVLFFAAQLYPEIPAALALTVAVRAIRRLPGAPAGTIARLGLALVALPLLKLRLAILGAALASWALVRLGRGRALAVAAGSVVAAAAACVALDRALGGLLYARYLARIPLGQILTPSSLMPARFLGIGLDQEFGLLPYAPVYALAALGLGPALRREPAAMPMLLAALAYVYPFLHSPDWHGGFSLPFRYYLVLVPLLALLVAHGLTVVGAGARARVAAAAGLASLALALGLTLWPGLRYNQASGRAEWLHLAGRAIGADVARLVPSAVNPYPETLAVTGLALAGLGGAVAAGYRARRRPTAAPPPPVAALIPGAALVTAAGLALLVVTARALPTRQVQGEHMEPRGPGLFFPGHDLLPFKAWVLRGPGDLSAPVTLPRGPVRLTVYAGGFSTDAVWPRLEVHLDGAQVGAVDVAAGAGAWATGAYVFPLPVSPGRHRLTFTLINGLDDRPAGRARHLLIDRIRLDG